METLWKDVRFAVRMLRRTPGVAAAAVVALALGIGANTAIFSVVDGVLLRPLPYRDSRALYVLKGKFDLLERADVPISYPEFKDILDGNHTLDNAGVFTQGDANLSVAGGAPQRVQVGAASATFLATLGVEPIVGRGFRHEEEFQGADQVALISFATWQSRFGGDGNVVGRTLTLDNVVYRIVGVLPRGFQIDGPCDLWVPLSTSDPQLSQRGSHWLKLIARTRPGVTRAQLDADLGAIGAHAREANPNNYRGGWGLIEKPLIDDVVGEVRVALFVLLAAVGFVLLIACANVANLLLARAAARRREMAIRAALGAGRARLIRQLLTESLLLSAVGAALGLLLALWGVDALVAVSPDALPRAAEVALDARVLAFTVVVALVTGVGFGLAPALAGTRGLGDALKDGTRGTSSSRGRLRKALVIAEVASSMVLLVGTGLMLRSFVKLRAVDPGLRAEHVLTLRASLPAPNGEYTDADRARWAAWFDRAAKRLAQLPGVRAVGSANILPFDGNDADRSFDIESYVPPSPALMPDNETREVQPGYFDALGVPLVRGRLLGDADGYDAPGALVINEAMARRYWPNGEDPIGRRIRMHARGKKTEWSTIVGIVGDVHGFGLDKPVRAEMYFPYAQMRRLPSQAFVLRVDGDPAAMANTVRTALAELDPAQPIFDVRPMSDLVASSLAQRRFALLLMLVFAAVALLLAAVGIYGVMSYTVAQRTQEIGIRMALGASPRNVLAMVVGDGIRLTAIGVGVGVAGALAVTRLVSSMLYGVSATDAPTFAAIVAVLAAAALVATVIPARRATRVDPMLALRAD